MNIFSIQILNIKYKMSVQKGKIGIFIDGNNLFYNAQQLNIEIDYTKLLRYVANKDQYSKAYFYGIIDSNNDKQQGFYTWLRHNGFKVITKYYTNSNNFNSKNSLDIELVVDLMKYKDVYDTMIIVGATNEVQPCLQYLQQNGIRVEFYGMKMQIVSESVDNFVDLGDIKHLIGKQMATTYEKYTHMINSVKSNSE